jgi:ankyrin repeat protein
MSGIPNLDRLRKEAKALLKQIRAGDVAAMDRIRAHLSALSTFDTAHFARQIKLADVHHALAREHGYPNWAELKRHDAPLERFLTAVRSGALKTAQRELATFPDLARSSIHGACAIGDADAVRYHLDLDPKLINAEDGGWPPLLYACASRFHQVNPRHAAGIFDCVSLLLDRGADPDTYTLADPSDPESKIPALARARFSQPTRQSMGSFDPQIPSLLLQRGAGEPAIRSISSGMGKAIQTLIPKNPFDDALTQLGPTFLQDVRKCLAPVKNRFFALPAGRDPHQPQRKDGLITPPPFMTEPDLRKVAIELAELALERGIDVNVVCEEDGSTFLHGCALLGDPAIAVYAVGWLLAHGADPNLPRNDGQTPFVLAVRLGNTAAAEEMRAHGADMNSVQPVDELMGACRNRDVRAAGEILRQHPEVLAALSPEAYELLVTAAAANRPLDVRFMAQLGFDLGGMGENGATALHVASWNGLVEMVRLLIELKAPVNIRDATFGTSPLAWAAQGSRNSDKEEDYCRVVEALLDAGADYASCVNRWGAGLDEIACARVASLLRSRGFSK